MSKGEHTYNINRGQLNINHGSGTINASYSLNKDIDEVNELLTLLKELQNKLDLDKEMSFMMKHSLLSQTESIVNEVENENVPKTNLQQFRDFLANCLPELQAFSTIFSAVSMVKDVIDMKFGL